MAAINPFQPRSRRGAPSVAIKGSFRFSLQCFSQICLYPAHGDNLYPVSMCVCVCVTACYVKHAKDSIYLALMLVANEMRARANSGLFDRHTISNPCSQTSASVQCTTTFYSNIHCVFVRDVHMEIYIYINLRRRV